jgi:hypothetical protein
MLARPRVNARGGHPPQDHWHQLFWCEAAPRAGWGAAGADVLQSAEVRPPDLSSGAARRARRAGRRGINSGMENNSVLRRFLVCALAALSAAGAWGTASPAARAQDAPKEEKPKKQEAPKPAKPDRDNPTGEQVAETVVLVYGSRAGLQQIRRTGVERGKITRTAADGRPEEISYERTFKRGETFDKDKVRLDQRMSTLEYSLVFNDGRVTGILRGTPFTPKQEDVSWIMTDRVHGIDSLLRYKESGAAVKFNGKESQKGLDLWVVELTDKEKQVTRYYISAKTARVLWLEYEEAAVKYKRTFHNYRIVQGTLVPYRTVLYAGDKQVEESQVLTVTYGVRMEDSLFAAQSASAAP